MRYIDALGQQVNCREKKHPTKTNMVYLMFNLFFFCHSSKMYRFKKCYKFLELPDGELIDFTMHIYHALNSHIGYVNQKLGVYRYGVGISKTHNVNFNVLSLTKDSFIYALKWKINYQLVNQAYFRFILKVIYGNFLNKIWKIDENLIDKNLLSSYQIWLIKLINRFNIPFIIVSLLYHNVKKRLF